MSVSVEKWEDMQERDVLQDLRLDHELREQLDELGLYTLGAVWEYAARSGNEVLLVAIDRYCADNPDVPLPSEVYPNIPASRTADKAKACDEIVMCHDRLVILQIEHDRIKAELKEAKDALEEAKAMLIATIAEVKQELSNNEA